jgi:LCP family protein required for cell wall assembly
MSATTSPFGGADRLPSGPGMDRASTNRSAGRAGVPGAYGAAAPPRPVGRDDHSPYYGSGGGGNGGGPPTSGGGGGGGRGNPYRGGRKRPNWKRIALVAGAVVLVVALIGGLSLWNYTSNLDKSLARTDPFSAITGGRPAKTVDGALNILLVGSDSRDPDAPVDKSSAWRADTIIVMHIPADHKEAQLISIPRDLYVPIPDGDSAPCDSGARHKINAAFAFGGLPRAVRTVECMTDVRIDHVLAIDFGGFKEVTDAIGGVDLKVERSITSIHKPHRKFTKGTMHMDGAQALDWIRQRKQFPEGDFARMRHQQDFLRALMDKAASSGTLTSPTKLNDFLKATTAAVTVDNGFSMVDMAVQFRSLRGENLTFITSPNKGSETINGESVVVADREKALALYKAVTADKMADWAAANQPKKQQ